MNDKFFDLKREKQDRIINAALKIFSKNPYQYASTDDIVKEAGISKGLLFHYFGSKSGLYTFLYAYSTKYYSIEAYRTVSIKENDYFELLKQIEYANFQTMLKYPYMPRFLDAARTEEGEEVRLAIAGKRKEYQQEYDNILSRADSSGWKDNENQERAMHIVQYTLTGIKETYYNKEKDLDAEVLYQEIVAYLGILKSWLYEG